MTTGDPASGSTFLKNRLVFGGIMRSWPKRIGVFYVPNWQAYLTAALAQQPPDGEPEDVFIDVALSIDSSGSMQWNDPQDLRKTASKSFIDALIDGDRVAVIDFDGNAEVLQSLTTDFTAAKSAVDQIDSSGGTSISAAVSAANNELIVNADPARPRVAIVLTDGVGSYSTFWTQQAIDNDITIYTIGLGSGVSETLLQTIANETGGQYFPVANADDLPEVFSRIAQQLDPAGDEDGDGLPNGIELEGVYSPFGVIATNPFDPDTDGDGLNDGEEIVEIPVFLPLPGEDPDGVRYRLDTNPLEADTDRDQLTDLEELEFGTRPRSLDTDREFTLFDDIIDGSEVAWGFDPFDTNPDGDTYNDQQEFLFGQDPYTFDLTSEDHIRAAIGGALFGEAGDNIPAFDFSIGELAEGAIDAVLPGAVQDRLGDAADAFKDAFDLVCESKGGWATAFRVVTGAFVGCYLGDKAGELIDEVADFRLVWKPDLYPQAIPYLVGWLALDLIPGVDIVAGLRDALTQFLEGNIAGGALDLVLTVVGLIPAVGDALAAVPVIAKFIERSSTARKAATRWFVQNFRTKTNFRGAIGQILGISDDLIDDLGGWDNVDEILEAGNDIKKLESFVTKGGAIRRADLGSGQLASAVSDATTKWRVAKSSASAGRLATEALSTEAAVRYLSDRGYDIVYVNRNVPLQVDAAGTTVSVSRGPDIIARTPAPESRPVVVEVKGRADRFNPGGGTLTSTVGGNPRTQPSADWLEVNSGTRYRDRWAQAAQFDPDFDPDALAIVDGIIDDADQFDVVVFLASSDTRVGPALDTALVDTAGNLRFGNQEGRVEVATAQWSDADYDQVLQALTPP